MAHLDAHADRHLGSVPGGSDASGPYLPGRDGSGGRPPARVPVPLVGREHEGRRRQRRTPLTRAALPPPTPVTPRTPRTRVIPPPTLLSPRHERVLALRGQGFTLKFIAIELGLAESTVCTLLSIAQRSLNLARWEVGGPGQQISSDQWALRLEGVCSRLSSAEAEVVRLVAEGRSNQDIAVRRQRSMRTVANQVVSIFRKLRIGSRIELFALLHDARPHDARPHDGTSTPRPLVGDQANAA